MDKKLTYSIYYTPNSEYAVDNSDVDYLCWDKKVHIRFRDFNAEELIIGFEKKLTYLLTYLMNYSYRPKVIGLYNNKQLIDSFLKTSDVNEILETIKVNIKSDEFKGIKLATNYKKTDCETFGDVIPECFPANKVNDVNQTGSLNLFLKTLRINLVEYLFNDEYVIIIRQDKKVDINKKFVNKNNKKLNRISKNLDTVELW